MKKSENNLNPSNTDLSLDKNLSSNQIKTTNINVLLNRVRIEKKNIFKKKLFTFTFVLMLITFIIILISN